LFSVFTGQIMINHSQFCFRGILWFSHKIAPYSVGCPTFGVQSSSAAGRYTSDAVPAVVPDGGINALSGLRVLCWFKQRRPAQAQRRRAAGDRTEFDEESGCRKAKTRLLGGFFK
ncbi:hypothetical protein, partial [Klebsiella pneumoniae]